MNIKTVLSAVILIVVLAAIALAVYVLRQPEDVERVVPPPANYQNNQGSDEILDGYPWSEAY